MLILSILIYSMKSDETPINVIDELEENLRLSVTECLIPLEQITVGEIIGTGEYKDTIEMGKKN